MRNILILILASVAIPVFAEEVVDRVVAQVGSEPILETELFQAAILEAQNAGIDISKDDSKIDSLKRQVLKSIVDFRILLDAAKNDTNVKVADADAKGKASDDYQRLTRQAGGESNLSQRFGMPIRKIKKNLEDNALNTMKVQRFTELKMQNVHVTRSDVEKFWDTNKSSFPDMPAAIRLANILISVKPSDSARANAMRRADSIATIARSGVDFAELAKKSSDDELSAKVGGDLGEASRGTFLSDFEAAAYKLSDNGISDPVETTYGFHVIKLHWKRGNKFHVSHILVSLRPTHADTTAALNLADHIADLLKAGAPFDSLAKVYSQDAETAAKGGDMDWFEKAKIPDQFASKVNSLKTGEWTGPFVFKGGYHFLKIAEEQASRKPDLQKDWDRIERIVQANVRADAYKKLVESLQKSVFIQYRN